MSACATVVALALLAAGVAHAQSNAGTAIGQFLLIDPGARHAAMGNVGVSTSEGVQSVYYNPAAIGVLPRWELTFTHAAWFAGITFDHAATTFPLGKFGNGYASITALGSGDMDVRTVEQPLGTGEQFTVSNIALGLGYGLPLTDRVSAGVQVNLVQERIWHSTAGMVTLSLGTLYQAVGSGLRIGASLSNFGTRSHYEGRDLRIIYDYDPNRVGDNNTLPGVRFVESYPVPQLFRVGLGMPWKLGNGQQLTVGVDALHPSDNTESVNLGAEYAYRTLLAVRLGYRNLFMEDAEGGLTAGAGTSGQLDTVGYKIDYAWADHGRLESTHRVTLGVTF